MLARADDINKLNLNETHKKRLENIKLRHTALDFYTPHEFGGLGEPIEEKYKYMNTFSENIDIPVIKPRTTVNNKNEFNVAIEKTSAFDVADIKLFKKPIREQAEDESFIKLRQSIQDKRKELLKERDVLVQL